jgi:hypothetical protein
MDAESRFGARLASAPFLDTAIRRNPKRAVVLARRVRAA